MKKKKTAKRVCVSCLKEFDKNDLLRIVKEKSGKVFLDLTPKANGRGAYICKDKACLAKAKEKKLLNQALKTNIDEHIYEEIEAYVEPS